MGKSQRYTETICVRLTPQQADWLQGRVEDGRSMASVVRQLIVRGMKATVEDAAPPKQDLVATNFKKRA